MWTAVIRLAPDVSLAAANAELKAFAARATAIDAHNKDWTWRAQPVREHLLSGADNAVVFIQPTPQSSSSRPAISPRRRVHRRARASA